MKTTILILLLFIAFSATAQEKDTVQSVLTTDPNYKAIVESIQNSYVFLNNKEIPNRKAHENMAKEIFEVLNSYNSTFQVSVLVPISKEEMELRTFIGDKYIVTFMDQKNNKNPYMVTSDSLNTMSEVFNYMSIHDPINGFNIFRYRNGKEINTKE